MTDPTPSNPVTWNDIGLGTLIPMEPHTGKFVYERVGGLTANLVAMADAVDARRTSELSPIPLSEREPEPEDLLFCGPCSLAWFGHEIPGGYWSWELTDVCFSHEHTHWLPASVRFLPARVQP